MSLGGRLISFFTAFVLFGVLSSILLGLTIHIIFLLGIPFFLYIVPLIVFRVHHLFFPLKDGAYDLSKKSYSAWWGAHQIQLIYTSFPCLEAFLRCFPGVYSGWLRLWGAKIGRNVYWTPQVSIEDRSLIQVGDHVTFGHKTICVSHLIKKGRRDFLLIVRKIHIGEGCFIGAGTWIGPGTILEENTFVPIFSHLCWHKGVEK